MNSITKKPYLGALIKVLSENDDVVFAYLYGSVLSESDPKDIDIAVFTTVGVDPNRLSSDLKVSFHNETGLPPDIFDVRILNDLSERGDVFGLLYLRRILEEGNILVDKDPDKKADFLERYGLRFRECEGLIQEVLA